MRSRDENAPFRREPISQQRLEARRRSENGQHWDPGMIRIRDLRVDYDNICAVRDMSLEIEPGEVCGLIGPNGAGKTTTMRAMIGLIEPTYGEIEVLGVDVREHPEDVHQIVGFMPDFPPLYEDLLVWEFLDLFAASYGIPRPSRRAEVGRYLEMVGLTERRNSAVVELSRGMRQRLMLAKTLIPAPRVLLLDEPASGVDPQGRIDLKNILRRLAEERTTVLISSHILAEMNEFCTSVAIMERGSLVISGRIDEVNRRVMGDSLLAVEVLGDSELFLALVGADERAGPVERKNHCYEFRFQGDSESAAGLLTTLVERGVRVAAFERRRDNLEELFLKVGSVEQA
jgi:ABC-2 type transport system ATP-binding protein